MVMEMRLQIYTLEWIYKNTFKFLIEENHAHTNESKIFKDSNFYIVFSANVFYYLSDHKYFQTQQTLLQF